MAGYCSIQELKLLGTMPAADIDALESAYPGMVQATIDAVSGQFDSRLAKRYAAPFASPYPQALVFNVVRLVAYRLWMKRGFNPNGIMDQALAKDAEQAEAWLKEAADSKDGLVELPSRQTALGTSAVSAGGPLGYSEHSPYTWTTLQREGAANGG